MIVTKRSNWWVMPFVFLPTFMLTVVARGMISGVWMDRASAVTICTMVLLVWLVGLSVFRARYFARNETQ